MPLADYFQNPAVTHLNTVPHHAYFIPFESVQSAVENYLVSHFGDYSFSQFLAEMFAKLYTMKTAITAADRPNGKVLPFFERYGFRDITNRLR